VAAILLIACAEFGGASMARFKLELARGARAVMLARPAVHGLVGVRDVDEQIIDEALVKFESARARRGIILLLTVGGAAYPFGYLLWSALGGGGADGGGRTALDLLGTNPRPTEDEIRHGLSAVLCRCTGYQGIVAAVAAAAPVLDPPQ
jgi:hypothetical protein